MTATLLTFKPLSRRKVLLVFPKYSNSFGTFHHAFPLMGDVQAFMPPQGILLIAALIPTEWEVRFVDENIRPSTNEEFEWSDMVFISGMHIQRGQINDINARAHSHNKVTALGGPSVSSAPDFYPEVDLLHCGEVGDATVNLFMALDKSVERPPQQVVYRTVERMAMSQFPSPAYYMVNVSKYLLGSVQFSSGCPFTCEFCDIPALYGRNPRLKTPQQVIHELDQLREGGAETIYFVDDNFIGNPKATHELLIALAEWQKKHDYTVRLSCEATLNLSKYPDILALMRKAYFITVFCGIETPEPNALKAMGKTQNLRDPILESVETFNKYGIEVASGIIMGFDTDTPETPRAILDFVKASHIPILTMNILYALPNTRLYTRLQAEGRLTDEPGRDSNIIFIQPYEEVVEDWRNVVRQTYQAEAIYNRFDYQSKNTFVHRMKPTKPWKQATPRNLKRALSIMSRIIWHVGIKADYRRLFWKMFWENLKTGQIESIFHISMISHHLITYARECTRGSMQASNYSHRVVEPDQSTKAA
ncbi:MAG: B12-binding domain-containing radical SAM protein [Verrucomicrobiota bacterium]|nr:B12-binding domain-containing radical SAM protein [Verrucomicrobiota bacterium]